MICDSNKEIYIFGAHSRGRTFKEYILKLYPGTCVAAFLVDDLTENELVIDGISVIEVNDDAELNTDYPVYIATRSTFWEKITGELKARGMKNIIPVDVELDRELRNQYVKRTFEEQGREFVFVDRQERVGSAGRLELSASIYVASSANDKELQEAYKLEKYEKIIQAGAELTDARLKQASAFDNTGDNISAKNRQYCELTALYWMWKNATEDIVGLAHYRRHFLLPDGWQSLFENGEIDVILPVPLFVAPNVEENYKQRHAASEWLFIMDYLKRNSPREYEAARNIFSKGLYSPCNMLITRKYILDELCDWLFPMLDAVVGHSGEREDAYQNRYPGFLAERMITLFFKCHRDRLRVAYADKNFLQ